MINMNKKIMMVIMLMLAFIVSNAVHGRDFKCVPTPEDSLGPFYTPNAPSRSSIGEGYVLSGTVKSARDCSTVSGAKIELWLAGPDGRYDDEHRAVVLSAASGEYSFESNVPPKYSFRPPHIHIRVTAENFKLLVTQHYPIEGSSEGNFPLVLKPL
jgi:protocatechuate 3,4-dioxygenase beta subunit